MASAAADIRILEVEDERGELAREALALIGEAFPARDRQPLHQIGMEIAEKRLGLLTSYDFHLLAATTADGVVAAIAAGVYLGGVNAGFVTYLAVRPEQRSMHLGRRMRVALIECFRDDADRAAGEELRWVIGEVRLENPWLRRLVRDRGAIPFDLDYHHPGVVPGEAGERWVLYRQPVGDFRERLPREEVARLLYAVWRRAYRIRWPLESAAFRRMLDELADRPVVGAHPGMSGSEGA